MARKIGSKDRKKRKSKFKDIAIPAAIAVGATGLIMSPEIARMIKEGKNRKKKMDAINNAVEQGRKNMENIKNMQRPKMEKMPDMGDEFRKALDAKHLEIKKQSRSRKLQTYRAKQPVNSSRYYKEQANSIYKNPYLDKTAKKSEMDRLRRVSYGKVTKEMRGRMMGFAAHMENIANFAQSRQQRKMGFRQKLKGVGGSALGGAATGAGLGYGVGHLFQKGSSIRETKIGTGVGLAAGAAIGAYNKYRQNAAKTRRGMS